MVLKGFRKRFRRKRPALFILGQWHVHQDNASVHNSILVTDYLSKMGIKTVPHPNPNPIVQALLPVTFGYSLSSQAVVMRQLRRWKRLWRSLTHWHKRTSMGLSRSCCNGTTSALQPEELTSKGTSVSCVLSIKVPIRKNLETFLMILVHQYLKSFMSQWIRNIVFLFIVVFQRFSRCAFWASSGFLCPNILSDKNFQTLSQKFRQIVSQI